MLLVSAESCSRPANAVAVIILWLLIRHFGLVGKNGEEANKCFGQKSIQMLHRHCLKKSVLWSSPTGMWRSDQLKPAAPMCELTGESTSSWQQLIFRLYGLLLKHSAAAVLRVRLTFWHLDLLEHLGKGPFRCPWGPAEDKGGVGSAPSGASFPSLLEMCFMTCCFSSGPMICNVLYESILIRSRGALQNKAHRTSSWRTLILSWERLTLLLGRGRKHQQISGVADSEASEQPKAQLNGGAFVVSGFVGCCVEAVHGRSSVCARV